jgi:membrane protein required for colicin V production
MTWVDAVVLAVLALSALLALSRGLVREVLSLGAWVGAILAAVWALPRVRPQVHQWLGESPWVDPVAFALVFVISLIVLSIVARMLSNLVRGSVIGGLDRTLGLLFGLVRGAALVIVAYILAGMVVEVNRWPDAVLQSQSVWPAFYGARWVVDRIPDDHKPRLYPPPGRETTAEELLRASPQGRAVNRQ